MKANLNLFSDLMTMPDKESHHKNNSTLKGYIWFDGKLVPISALPKEGTGLNWYSREFVLGTKGRVMIVHVQNNFAVTKKVKIFFESRLKRPFQQYGYISPENDCIFIYNQNELQLVNGTINGSTMKQCAVFPAENFKGKISSDLKKGRLDYQPIAKGSLSSLFSLEAEIPGGESIDAWAWAVQGNNNDEVLSWNREFTKNALAMS